MKATKLLLATALFTSLATLSLAGPGAEYWARMTQAAKDNAKAAAKTQPAAAAPKDLKVTTVATCATCGCPAMKKS